MSCLCLTGWQQKADALASIAPRETLFAAYEDYDNVPDFFASLPSEVDIAIGWSLGGQLLVRAIAGGHVKAQQLVLLGAPFQFLASEKSPYGLPEEMWLGILESYKSNPADMIKQFCGHIAAGDSQASAIIRTLSASLSVWKNGVFWLEELGRFSCSGLDFSKLPPTLIIHGVNDKVIRPEQTKLFAKAISISTVQLLEQCGHAPHLHDVEFIKRMLPRV